jgi:superfamily I DNA/RNA helicase
MSASVLSYTPQQAAVRSWTREGKGNALVIARAGTGKSFLLLSCIAFMRGSVLVAAFNTAIANEMATKIAAQGLSAQARTFNSLGAEALRKVYGRTKLDANKFDIIAKTLDIPQVLRSFVRSVASKAKQRAFVRNAVRYNNPALTDLKDQQAWMDIITHFKLDETLVGLLSSEDNKVAVKMLAEKGYNGYQTVLRYALNLASRAIQETVRLAPEVIDFDDQLYLPVVLDLRLAQYDWVLVDEAQDTNPLRRILAHKLMKPHSRAIFCGDDRQSIYGFTGADTDSLSIIGNEFATTNFPLTVTHRCPKAVVELARTLVPDYEAADGASEGSVEDIDMKEFGLRDLRAGDDAIICRNTRPLVALAYSLLKRGIACHVEGREIGRGLIALVTRWKSVRTVEDLVERLTAYREEEVTRLEKDGKSVQAEAVTDRVDTIMILTSTLAVDQPVIAVVNRINDLFRDTKTGERSKSISLMTAHRSKGLEFKRIYLLGANRYMPSPMATLPHEIDQENNLLYVSWTRAQEELIRVSVPMKDEAEDEMIEWKTAA